MYDSGFILVFLTLPQDLQRGGMFQCRDGRGEWEGHPHEGGELGGVEEVEGQQT